MQTIINWLNCNNGAVMAILTFVYVAATILICSYNHKSAIAAQQQTAESRKQFEEQNRAHVIPKFDVLEGQLYCIVFQNIGKTMADNLQIIVSPDWIDCLKKTQKNSDTGFTLEKLSTLKVFLAAEDKYMYPICIPADGTNDYSLLCQCPLTISISYTSAGKPYKENFELPMKGINCLINNSNYVRMEQKKRESINDISTQLAKISNNLHKPE